MLPGVNHDTEIDQCVGFVLPVDQHGLPLIDSFTATSFSAIESMFKKMQFLNMLLSI